MLRRPCCQGQGWQQGQVQPHAPSITSGGGAAGQIQVDDGGRVLLPRGVRMIAGAAKQQQVRMHSRRGWAGSGVWVDTVMYGPVAGGGAGRVRHLCGQGHGRLQGQGHALPCAGGGGAAGRQGPQDGGRVLLPGEGGADGGIGAGKAAGDAHFFEVTEGECWSLRCAGHASPRHRSMS